MRIIKPSEVLTPKALENIDDLLEANKQERCKLHKIGIRYKVCRQIILNQVSRLDKVCKQIYLNQQTIVLRIVTSRLQGFIAIKLYFQKACKQITKK